MAAPKNNNFNPKGRPKGKPNRITQDIKEAFSKLLENKIPELEDWMTQVGQEDPAKALDIWIKISERFVPALSRAEVTGSNGRDLFENVKFTFITAESDEEDSTDRE